MNLLPVNWVVSAVVGASIGFVAGLVYFERLRQSASRFAEHGPAVAGVLVGAFVRIIVAVGVFVCLMIWSPSSALWGLVGFALARWRALTAARST